MRVRAALFTVVLTMLSVPNVSAACTVGETVRAPRDQRDASTPHVVIGCGKLPFAGKYKAVAYRTPADREGPSQLVVDIRLAGGFLNFLHNTDDSAEAESYADTLSTGSVREASSNYWFATGFATDDVASVSARRAGQSRSVAATFFRITDPAMLAKLKSGSFSYYLVVSPLKSRKVVLKARNDAGAVIAKAVSTRP